MKAYLIQIGNDPAKISICKDTALAYIRKLVAGRIEREESRNRSNATIRTKVSWVDNVSEHPAALLKAVIFQEAPPTRGRTIIMEYRIYELDLIESALEMLAAQAE